MEIIKLNEKTAPSPVKTVVAVGNFDGVHKGHQALLEKAVSLAEELGAAPAVWSFENYTPRSAGVCIVLPEDRNGLFGSYGAEKVFLSKYEDVSGYSAKRFVKDVLRGKCGAVCAVCGYNFRFGKNASAGADDLEKLMKEYGGSAYKVEAVKAGGETVSSTSIRGYLCEGEPKKAAALLGRPYYIDLPVVHGRRLGTRLGFPTINQVFPKGLIVPRYGAYACYAHIDGVRYKAVSDVGIRPTVDGAGIISETHIIGFDGDLYSCSVKVEFIEFLRPERKFDSLDALKAQIGEDVKTALRILS